MKIHLITTAIFAGLALPLAAQTAAERAEEFREEVGVEEPDPHVEALDPDMVTVDVPGQLKEAEVEVSELRDVPDVGDNFPDQKIIEDDTAVEAGAPLTKIDESDLNDETNAANQLRALRTQVRDLTRQNEELQTELDSLRGETAGEAGAEAETVGSPVVDPSEQE